MADYDAGRAFLQIVPSFRGVRESIKKQAKTWADEVEAAVEKALPEGFTKGSEKSEPVAKKKGTETGEAYGGAFARTVKLRIEAALKSLPKVKVDADSSLADVKLAAIRAELEALSKKQIGVDVSDTDALAQLERLKTELGELGAGSTSVQVRADTATAAAELDKLAVQIDKVAAAAPTVQVDADTAEADAKLSATQAKSEQLAASSPSIIPDVDPGGALIGIAQIRAALLALAAAPIVIPIAVAGASLLGPLAAAGVGAAGFAAVAAPGLGRIHTAIQAQDSQSSGGGRSAASQVSATNSIRLAQLGLADAQRNVAATARQNAQAQAQAAEQVRQAEQSLTQAQRQAKDAQLALNQARLDAKRGLEDLANNLADARLAQRRGALALQDAQANLTAVNADPRSTAEQRSQAQLAVDEAKQALAEQQQAINRLAADKKTADKAGVAGSQQVLHAEQALADARRNTADKQRALAKARADQVNVELQNTERTIQAQEQVTRAQLGLSSAQASAAAASAAAAGSTSKLDKALQNLSPTERAAMGAFRDFGQAYRDWVTALEPDVFPAITGGLDLIKALLGPLTPIVQAAALAFHDLERDAAKALQDPFWKTALDTLGRLTGPAILAFGHIVGNILTGIAGIGLALSPTGGGVLRSLENLSEKFATFGKNASKPGGFQDFITWVRTNLPKAVDWLKSVGTAIVDIGIALLPIGGLVLGGIKLLADVIDRMPPALLGAIATAIFTIAAATKAWALATKALAFFQAIFDGELAPIIILVLALAAAFAYAWKNSETFRTIVSGALAGIGKAFGVFGRVPDGLRKIWGDIKNIFLAGVNGIIDLINGLVGGINWVLEKLHIPKFPLLHHVGTPAAAGKGGGGGGSAGGVSGHVSAAFAAGGVLPGYAPGVDSVHAMLSPGEAVLVPEAVRAIGPDTILGWNSHFSRGRAAGPSKAGGFAGGGLVDRAIAGLEKLGDIGEAIARRGAAFVVDKVTNVVAGAAGHLPGLTGQIGSGTIRYLGGQITDWLEGQRAGIITAAARAAAGATGGAGVTRWAGTAGEALAQLGQPTSLVSPVLQLIKFESGGNPLAVNREDVNWRHGTPSVGLAQVIGPTFAGNAGPYAKTGPFLYGVSTNPLANVYAGLHYGIGRYGSVTNIPGIRSVLAGGPYLPYDQGGYLPPGMSVAINGTGRPEPILTSGQWQTLAASARGGDGPQRLTGTLDLGNGLTGYVDGVLEARERQQARQVSYGRRTVAV